MALRLILSGIRVFVNKPGPQHLILLFYHTFHYLWWITGFYYLLVVFNPRLFKEGFTEEKLRLIWKNNPARPRTG